MSKSNATTRSRDESPASRSSIRCAKPTAGGVVVCATPAAAAASASVMGNEAAQMPQRMDIEQPVQRKVPPNTTATTATTTSNNTSNKNNNSNKKLLLWRRFRDGDGVLRNFMSLPLFVYPTSASTCSTSADGVGVSKDTVCAQQKNEAAYALASTATSAPSSTASSSAAAATATSTINTTTATAIEYKRNSHSGNMSTATATASASSAGAATGAASVSGTSATLTGSAAAGGNTYQPHLALHGNSNSNSGTLVQHLLGAHATYGNNYALPHPAGAHHPAHIHSDQTKSLQELQHEVGALLEFRDLVIETFPDLKHKMASMSSSVSGSGSALLSAPPGNGSAPGAASMTLASRREWEPGIRGKRKLSQKEGATATTTTTTTTTTGAPAAPTTTSSTGGGGGGGGGGAELSSLTRSRSNSHSGKKEPKSGENNSGSVIQDSGFSTETSSSKEAHSAPSSNGAITVPLALNRLACLDADDELLNLLDVIHRKSNRLREEVEHLQHYEQSTTSATFREQVERLSKEDMQQLRRERDRLLDKLAEMEAETLTGRIKTAKMSDQLEQLMSVKRDLEEQLKLAMAQKLELSSRIQQLQLQQLQPTSKSIISSPAEFLGRSNGSMGATGQASRRSNTFQPVVVEQQQQQQQYAALLQLEDELDALNAFHQSAGSDSKQQQQQQQQQQHPLGRLDGIVSTPGARNARTRTTDSKRFAAILLETNVIELQRHLLTLTVQNQVLMQKLEQAGKTKTHLAKRLDKSKEDVEDLRFQLEEKNIELEGTKAQLRVLESRMHSSAPSSGIANGSAASYMLHSQNDYETNRSSASTTLVLSRRLESPSPLSGGQMPAPIGSQISTPSMKAMVHLPMDEIQQHSSSTESAHDHDREHANHHDKEEEQQREHGHDPEMECMEGSVTAPPNRLMSTSVGGVSPFQQQQQQQQQSHQSVARRFGPASKPSKIPLPGAASKGSSYFSGKPPSGRGSAAGRSPPSANSSSGSHSSSRSSLSRSTGNLLYAKSLNSLKRADSAQSIRKDTPNSSSLSTSTSTNASSRSSTTSSIPLATTPYGAAKHSTSTSSNAMSTSPSSRALQNSPLPKPKRDTLTSRMRHLDSLSRLYQQHASNSSSNASDTSAASPTTAGSGGGSGSSGGNLVSSTPKPSALAAHGGSATVRKDLSSSSFSTPSGTTPYQRRNAAPTSGAVAATMGAARRFSSASMMATRSAARHQRDTISDHALDPELNGSVGGGGVGGGGGGGGSVGGGSAGDTDSGKSSVSDHNQVRKDDYAVVTIAAGHTQSKSGHRVNFAAIGGGERRAAPKPLPQIDCELSARQFVVCSELDCEPSSGHESSWYRAAMECNYVPTSNSFGWDSNNLLVTFDYGYSESVGDDSLLSREDNVGEMIYEIEEKPTRWIDNGRTEAFVEHESTTDSLLRDDEIWYNAMWHNPSESEWAQRFQVHRMQHANLTCDDYSTDSLDTIDGDARELHCSSHISHNSDDEHNRHGLRVPVSLHRRQQFSSEFCGDAEQFYDSIESM